MTFASIIFLLFFSIVILLLSITNIQYVKVRLGGQVNLVRHVILLLSSYIFYGWWDWRFCFLMFFITLVAYWAGIFHKQKYIITISVSVVLAILALFKYYIFFVDSLFNLLSIHSSRTLNIILPVGISFYTFQAISYIIDVHRNKISYEKSFLHVALYISFFPQLVAGPIVKASDFLPQLKEERNVSIQNLEHGIQIFIFGLFKKIVLADNLSVYVDEVFQNPNVFNAETIVLAIISYAMQIYFDFSGYSDMAIGSAKCLGYDFTKNFNLPYLSKNVSEFWTRWHISLSSWLKEYLYIPLGGNRKGIQRTYINLILTMMIGGLWHGANWTFVIWGTLHGIALCVQKIFTNVTNSQQRKPNFATTLLAMTTSNIFICFCWVFFRADSIDTALTLIKRVITLSDGVLHIFSWTLVSLFLLIISHICAIIHSTSVQHTNSTLSKATSYYNGYYMILNLNKILSLIIFFVVIGLTIGLAYTGASPFIYFQF